MNRAIIKIKAVGYTTQSVFLEDFQFIYAWRCHKLRLLTPNFPCSKIKAYYGVKTNGQKQSGKWRYFFMKTYGYARVSTIRQIAGNSLEEQESVLSGRGCQQIVVEQYTGKTTDRPKLKELISILQPGDTLIVTKLDRLARTVREGSELIQELISKDITVIIDNMGTISNKPMDKLMLNVLLAFAEFERDMIVERTQSGKAIAKTKAGFREGRPPTPQKKLDNAVELINSGHSYKEVVDITGLSKSTIIRAVRKNRVAG